MVSDGIKFRACTRRTDKGIGDTFGRDRDRTRHLERRSPPGGAERRS